MSPPVLTENEPSDPESLNEMKLFYNNGEFEIIERKGHFPLMGVPSPGIPIPNLKQDKNLYICGDFYRWSLSEASVASGTVVAEMISTEMS